MKATYTITVRAEGDGVPAIIRVRGLLKEALRRYGLRCVGLASPSGDSIPAASKPDPDNEILAVASRMQHTESEVS